MQRKTIIMSVEVKQISKEIIKPSSPTPDHLRRYQYSFLDQLEPPLYIPLLFFYEFNGHTQPKITVISNHLKKSLSQVLTLYYPLAGRVKDNKFIDCNDEGIPFVEAQVLNCTLSDVLKNPNLAQLNKFFPFELENYHNEIPGGVQLNMFQCGGFAIGQCVSHKLADGLSNFVFTNTWAATARGDQADIDPPQFVSAALFPPPKEFNLGSGGSMPLTKDKVTRRFIFNASEIETLRAKYQRNTKKVTSKRPSRVETLTAFIWNRFVEAAKGCATNKLYRVVQTVNLRPRFDPPLPQNSFGNIFHIALTSPLQVLSNSSDDEECDNGAVFGELREEISKIDNECIKKLQEGDELLQDMMKLGKDTATLFGFSSHCGFPLYENDFGWGRPTWVGSPALVYNNLVVFRDTKEGNGIEAYVSLEEKVMAKFECDSQLLSYVSPTGRVLMNYGN